MMEVLIALLNAAIRLAIPVLLAAIGEIFVERAGVLNLGIEGMMLMGAFISMVVTVFTGDYALGIFSGMLIGGAMGLILALLTISFRLDQILSGLSIYFLGWGLSTFLYAPLAPLTKPSLGTIPIPILNEIPIIGPTLFQQNILVYSALILVPVSSIIIFRTTFGLKIRSAGENPKAVDVLGINVYRIRYLCVIFGGLLAGLAGTFLSIGITGAFRENMVAGRGFVAIAIVYFGKWGPWRTLVGSLLFGGSYALQAVIQAGGSPIPYEFMLMLPYLLILIFLVLVSRGARGPAALGVPYERGR